MSGHDIIVVGASAGGVEALVQLVRNFPPDLPAAIFVVLHIPAHSTSVMPRILNRSVQKHQGASLQAEHAQEGEEIVHGRIYVAPPNQHLLVKNGGYIRLGRGPKENSHRPAVDPLFRTAAQVYGRRVVGVVLSGTLDDGTAGLAAVKQQGGVALVQDPEEALYSGMPNSAVENVAVDHILPVSEIAKVLVELAYKPVEEEEAEAVSRKMEMEADIAELDLAAMQASERPGTPSPFACPDCAGVLWELRAGKLIRFRCRTGHAFSVNTLLAEQSQAVEEALWIALRALEERAALVERMANQAHERNQHFSAKRFEGQEQDIKQRAALIRQLLLKGEGDGDLSTFNGQVVGAQGSRGAEGEFLERHLSVNSPPASSASPPLFVVAFCASADRLEALTHILAALPADFPAAITVVHSPSPHNTSHLADILSCRTALTVKQAEEGDLLRPGTIYIAPPHKHLLANSDSTLCLSHSELVHFVRPSADLLLESVAASFKQRVIAVVLTDGGDGAMGIRAIKQMGGITIALAQDTSEVFGMPSAAIDTGTVDRVVSPNKIAAALVSLVTLKEEETQKA
jgi:two-component system chemotaxis response regulator CheB